MSESPAVSIVATFHNEGPLAINTLRTIEGARAFAAREGIATEGVLVADRPCPATLQALRAYKDGSSLSWRLHEVTCGDVGLARNAGVVQACGEFIATFDGDDYMSAGWIALAWRQARQAIEPTVFHPEFVVTFGAIHVAQRQWGTDSPHFDRNMLVTANPWNSCAFARREVFLAVPYAGTSSVGPGFGFEDWHWNCETLERGYAHLVVSGSLHLVRRKSTGSLSRSQSSERALIPPTRLLGSCVS